MRVYVLTSDRAPFAVFSHEEKLRQFIQDSDYLTPDMNSVERFETDSGDSGVDVSADFFKEK